MNCEEMCSQNSDRAIWHLLARSEAELNRADLIELNVRIATGIPALQHLDVRRYIRIVAEWTDRFADWLKTSEKNFHRTPWKWKNDLRFYRVGMLAGWLGNVIGLDYIEEQKRGGGVRYTNPSDLFVNGLIDTKRGTCANMPVVRRDKPPDGMAGFPSMRQVSPN